MNNTRVITDAELTENEKVNFLADDSGILKKMELGHLAGVISDNIYNTILADMLDKVEKTYTLAVMCAEREW